MVLRVLERWEITGLLAFTMCYGPRVLDLCYAFLGCSGSCLEGLLISWLVQRGDLLDIEMLYLGCSFVLNVDNLERQNKLTFEKVEQTMLELKLIFVYALCMIG